MKVTLCGLATDFCVAFSALDAVAQGFSTSVILEACRGIDLNGSLQAMVTRMRDAGVELN
jgi:nicotinamidase/pyrazinamidase